MTDVTLDGPIINWKHTSDDCVIAINAAITLSKRLQKDVAIMQDLKVVPLDDANEPPLEIIRYAKT